MTSHRLSGGIGIVASMFAASALGQTAPVPDSGFALDVDSGWVSPGAGEGLEVVFEEVVTIPDASWLRLRFGEVVLPGSSVTGDGAFLRITSWLDGAEQTLHSDHVAQWRNTSAYFNGDTVIVELLAPAGAPAARVQVIEAIAGDPVALDARTICDNVDDRQLSTDARAGRLLPVGCTAWLIDDMNHCFLSAGHCADGASDAQVVEFNVPLSTSGGSIVHPPPQDQYSVDPASLQVVSGSIVIGNDWAYFGTFPNPVTSMTAYQVQQASFELQLAQQSAMGQTLRITGYGTVSSSQGPREWSQVQKTHTGPISSVSGTELRYRADTTGGNSGSPVIDELTGCAIGIHTNGGCTSSGGSNSGTALSHAGLHTALNNPQGVCAVPFTADRFELARLVPPGSTNGDQFGASVALWEETAVVGAPIRANGGDAAAGAAYVFERGAGDWDIVEPLPLPPTLGAGEQFGFDVAIDGSRVVAAAPGNAVTSTVPQAGRVYVYDRDPSEWALSETLSPSAVALDDWYGRSVAVSGDWVVVGAPRDSASRGAVYVYQFTGGAWSLAETLRGPTVEARQFGYDVAMEGNRLLVGARNESIGGARAGGAYLYEWDGAAWLERGHFSPSSGATGDQFGASVALDGNMAAIGAPFGDDATASSGSVHLYHFDGAAWADEALLTAGDASIGDANGSAVAIADGVVLSGSPGNDDRGTTSGAMYRFKTEDDGTWGDGLPASTGSDTLAGDQLGTTIDAGQFFVAVGARLKSGGGAAYIFALRPCAADRDANAVADVLDLLDFLDDWFAGDADINQDLATDVLDLLEYLDAWFAGCD